MNVNSREKLEEDIQRLAIDAKNLVNDAQNMGAEEAKDFQEKSISILNKFISKLSEVESYAMSGVKDMSIKTDQFVHQKPWMAIGIAGLIGALIGVIIERRR